jgi:Asp-tRNAAsn/Glu-tRNAGln amidotransferase A subunit and related amidases
MDGMAAEIGGLWAKGAAWLKAAGAEIVDISLPHTKYALPTYYIIAPAEASSNLARYDGVRFGLRVPGGSLDEMYENTRAAGFGAEVKRRVSDRDICPVGRLLRRLLPEGAAAAQPHPRRFHQGLRDVDAILTPATPTPAFAVGERMDDPIAMYLNDVFTVPVNLAGLPGISVPAGLSEDGLPLGLQLIGRAFDEATLLRTARTIEQARASRPNRRGSDHERLYRRP